MVEFTKQHFEGIANIVNKVIERKMIVAERIKEPTLPIFDLNLELCDSFSNFLEGTNPKFNKDKFMGGLYS